MSALKHIRADVFCVSQSEFARIAGVTQATVSRWESEKFKPNLGELQKIRDEAEARGLRWEDSLFFDLPDNHPNQAAE